MRFDPRQQLDDIEWFGDIVVGAGLKADDDIIGAGTRCQDQHGHVRSACVVAQLADRLVAIHAWHRQIHQYQAWSPILRQPHQLMAVGRAYDLIAILAEGQLQQLPDVWVVVGNQYAPLRSRRLHVVVAGRLD